MRKKYLLMILSLCFLMTGCRTADKSSIENKEISQINKVNSESQEQGEEEVTEIEKIENETYEIYTGTWTQNGISTDEIISEGGTEFSVNITNKTELTGSLYSQQGLSERIAEIENITGIIHNNECYYEFKDDGWGGTGTLFIQFLKDTIYIEVKDYKASNENLSGFGITGIYQLKRVNKVVDEKESEEKEESKETKETTEQEMSELDLINEVYARYYSHWSEEKMITTIKEKSKYLEKCSFYGEVTEYMENVRGVTDIANVVEPLYYSDMKYYKKQDFDNVPSLIIHLAKNEIYANNGYVFKDDDLNNYFMGQLWYEPSVMAADFNNSVFNKYEKSNLKLLAELDTYK